MNSNFPVHNQKLAVIVLDISFAALQDESTIILTLLLISGTNFTSSTLLSWSFINCIFFLPFTPRKTPSTVSAAENAFSQAPLKWMALDSTSRASGKIDPSLNRSLIVPLVAELSQSFMIYHNKTRRITKTVQK